MAEDTPPRPPAKKTAAKRAPAKKTAAKRAPAKKTAAKRAPAKKTASRGRATEKGTTAPPLPPEPEGGTSAPARRGRATEKPAAAPEKGSAEPAAPGRTRQKITDAAKRVATPQPGKSYHRAVLAEFIICVILVLLGAILTPRVKNGVLEFVHVLVQLSAVCFVFFVLALLGAGKSTGKVAAAFGGLITLGVLLNSSGAILEIGKIFKGPQPQVAKSGTGQ